MHKPTQLTTEATNYTSEKLKESWSPEQIVVRLGPDGGSKFRDEFETTCEQLNTPLFALPACNKAGRPEGQNGKVVWDALIVLAVMSSIHFMRKA